MIPFNEIDVRLAALGKDRQWLAEMTPYSADYIRTVLAPNSKRRTPRVQQILSDAIEKEDSDQKKARISENVTTLDFTQDQWDEIEKLARRDGQPAKLWIASKIKAYLAFAKETNEVVVPSPKSSKRGKKAE